MAVIWLLPPALLLALGLVLAALGVRRAERRRLQGLLDERQRARALGSDRARLQHPHIDLSRCIGCGTCVAACPEEGVLELVHGQAVVVHGARCVGHGRCAAECPVGAIALTLGDVRERRDLPVLTEERESPHVPGLFLAGEVTGYALVRTAIGHGTAAADAAARRARQAGAPSLVRPARDAAGRGGVALADEPPVLDLVVVGAGPAGIACSLRAKELGLAFTTLEQDELGGTVAKYPRRKLVMTQPVDLPLAGRLSRTSYTKEELVALWERLAREHALPIRHGQVFRRVERLADGTLRVHTLDGAVDARSVVLALGRRGTPRRLGVPGEELPKVAYSLLDAHGYQGRRILVVGGGDSAVEAALGLAEQPGNQVVISYRKEAFFRLKSRNEARLAEALRSGALGALFSSEVLAIRPDAVDVRLASGGVETLANDEVFVFAGGTPPTEVLEASGVSFDPGEHAAPPSLSEQGTGLGPALGAAFVLAALVLAWVFVHQDYYRLPAVERPHHPAHPRLAPTGVVGLWCGVAAALCVLANLAYLARRSQRFPWIPGSLRAWMTSHVATGLGALLLVLVHGAMDPRPTHGGRAAWALCFLVLTGAIGRYLYSFVPRAANGRELELEEARTQVVALSSEWDRGRGGFSERIRAEVDRTSAQARWTGPLVVRLAGLFRERHAARRRLAALRAQALREGVAPPEVERLIDLARRAQRAALLADHHEELRGILASWRYFHRWVALFFVLVLAWHVLLALRYARLFP
ncbi:MAG: NAD(P)-binding domain-containing protein [Planctomycetes bacterium]|nr:NAD(P)-binding domain-containing protein [Planctomycetota bacterium]